MEEPASGEPLLEFLDVMRRLRAECSWKAGQTHRSLARYLLEETHETLEALDTGDAELLREELGDLLLQIYFHAVIAEEAGEFTIDDVAGDIVAKMIRRNPHVFGSAGGSGGSGGSGGAGGSGGSGGSGGAGGSPAEINEVWESIKAAEKRRTSLTDGLPDTLPALLYADKVLDRIERAGRASRAGPSAVSVTSAASGELGDRLLALVAEARRDGVDPEQALRDAVRRLLAAPPGTSPP